MTVTGSAMVVIRQADFTRGDAATSKRRGVVPVGVACGDQHDRPPGVDQCRKTEPGCHTSRVESDAERLVPLLRIVQDGPEGAHAGTAGDRGQSALSAEGGVQRPQDTVLGRRVPDDSDRPFASPHLRPLSRIRQAPGPRPTPSVPAADPRWRSRSLLLRRWRGALLPRTLPAPSRVLQGSCGAVAVRHQGLVAEQPRRIAPLQEMRPRDRTTAWPEMPRARLTLCSTRTIATPCELISKSARYSASMATGARPSEISSQTSTLGSAIRARPTASICCRPPDMVPASCVARSAGTGKTTWTRSMRARSRGPGPARRVPVRPALCARPGAR